MTAPPATHPKRTIVFWMATALIAVDTLLFTMVVPALPEFAERDGLSDARAALVFATFPVAQLVTALATAGLVERLGRRPLVVAATLLLAGATLMFAVTEGGAMLALARTAQGVAAGAAWTAGIAAISDVFPTRELGLRIGLARQAERVGDVLIAEFLPEHGIPQTGAVVSHRLVDDVPGGDASAKMFRDRTDVIRERHTQVRG